MPLRRRLGLILLVVLATSGCLALGWWQWSRYESSSGSFQNLGYALQWPLFAFFCLYAYRKFLRYEQSPAEARPSSDAITEVPADLLPERPAAAAPPDSQVMREYNAYLAELARTDAAADTEKRTTA